MSVWQTPVPTILTSTSLARGGLEPSAGDVERFGLPLRDRDLAFVRRVSSQIVRPPSTGSATPVMKSAVAR